MAQTKNAYAPGSPGLSVFPAPLNALRAPASSDIDYPIGQEWVFNDISYVLTSKSAGNASWLAGGGAPVASDAEAQAKTSTTVAVTPANLAAEGFLQYADVTLTSAQILLLATTPIELVAAPAAGAAIQFIGAVFKLNYGTNVFTEAGDNLGIKFTNAAGFQVSNTIECTGFIDASADTQINAIPAADAIVASSAAEAKALVLDNLGSNFGGNAGDDNTISVRTYYLVQSL